MYCEKLVALLKRKNILLYNFYIFLLLALAAASASFLLVALGIMGIVLGEALVSTMLAGALISIVFFKRTLDELDDAAVKCSRELNK